MKTSFPVTPEYPNTNMFSTFPRKNCCFIILLVAVLTLLGSARSHAALLDLYGSVAYHVSDDEGFVVLEAENLSNDSASGRSGTIRLELWAFSHPFNGSNSGYQLASYQLGELNAGTYFHDIYSGPIWFTRPPPGTWYFSIMAREYVGAPGDGFVTRDYINFIDPVRVAGGALAQDVDIVGISQWTIYNNGTVQMQVETLQNICDLGITGTLRLDAWASATKYSGGTMVGYRFGSSTLNPLPAGFAYHNLSRTVQYNRPPDGYYYVTMTVSEYIGGAYRILDYVSFPQLQTFGNPPPPLPSTPSSLTATKGTLTTGIKLTWSQASWASTYEVYRGTSSNPGSSTLIESGLTGTSYLDRSTAVGSTHYYWVKARNVSGRSGFSPGDWGYRNGIAPSIATQPRTQNAVIGQQVVFSVSANGTGPLAYQWRKGGADISGATRNTLTFADVQETDAGAYSVRITNAYGNVTSSTVSLAVYDPASLKILYWQAEDRRLALWYMDGTNRVTSVLARNGKPIPAGWTVRGFGDFNADTFTDILLQHNDGRLIAWLMEGPDLVGNAQLRTPNPGWRVTGVSDLNNDNKPDILLRHTDGRVALWHMNGTTFQNAVLLKNGLPVNLDWRLVGSADFNGDDHDDLLWHNKDGRVLVWLMNGSVLESTVFLRNGIPTGPGLRLSALQDLDGNTHPDLIWQTPDQRITSWLMDGTNLLRGQVLNDGKPAGATWKLIGPK